MGATKTLLPERSAIDGFTEVLLQPAYGDSAAWRVFVLQVFHRRQRNPVLSLRQPLSLAVVTTPDAPASAVAADGSDAVMEAFRVGFRDTQYFSVGREWTDYGPAYRCGLDAFDARLPGRGRFQDVEAELQRQWSRCPGGSRLCWVEARGAVEHAWQSRCSAGSTAGERRAGVTDDGNAFG